MPNFDINEIVNNPRLSLSITSSKDEHPKDACIRRSKDMALFSVVLVLVFLAFLFCGYLLLNHNSSIDDKKWATAVATSIISALLGYMTGKNINT